MGRQRGGERVRVESERMGNIERREIEGGETEGEVNTRS